MRYSFIATALFSLALAAPAPAITPLAELEKRQSSNVNVNGVGIDAASAARVQSSFTASGVVPTLIPSITPKLAVNAVYNTKAVDLGNQFTTLETVAPPTVQFTRAANDPGTWTYSFFIVDPDVPGPTGPPILGSPRLNFLHWYVSGVGGANKNTVTIYEVPTPVSPGQQHRYTFLVFKEPTGYQPNVVQAQVRPGFDLLGYASRGGLEQPLGGNFFNESISNGVLSR